MPKKMVVNTKAEAARARRSAAKADRRDRNARTKGEAYWQAAEGLKSHSARRHEEDAEKCTENRRLAELEQQQLAAATRRPDRKAARVGGPFITKVTEAELLRRREEERLRLEREAEAAKKRQARTADEEFERVVLVANTNRDDSIIEARSVEDAIAKMSIAAEPALPPDRYPERRLKVSYKVAD